MNGTYSPIEAILGTQGAHNWLICIVIISTNNSSSSSIHASNNNSNIPEPLN